MKIIEKPFDGVLVLQPQLFEDERGSFSESFEIDRYRAVGVIANFVQENLSRSKKGVLRGLHFTRKNPQAQLLTVVSGKIFDAVVDIRNDSPTFGKWFGTELAAGDVCQIYMTHGFAHGFCVLTEWADLHYKVSAKYDPLDEAGLYWNDSCVGIKWPEIETILSERDSNLPRINELFSSGIDINSLVDGKSK